MQQQQSLKQQPLPKMDEEDDKLDSDDDLATQDLTNDEIQELKKQLEMMQR
jgi:hypothetical protein